MLAYTLRRLLYAVPTTLGVLLITFLLFRVVAGDVAGAFLGPKITPKQRADFERKYKLNRPLLINVSEVPQRGLGALLDVQFVHFLKGTLTLSERSFFYNEPIWRLVLKRAPASLALTIPIFIDGVIIALAISLVAAFFRNTWFDRVLVVGCVMGMCVPELAVIIVGQYVFGYVFDWFPIYGFASPRYLLLPAFIWIVTGLGGGVRFYRTVFLEELHQDYVRTARAKGLAWPVILVKHVLKNAMIPILTQLVVALPFLMMGSLLLESFFGIPGMGDMLLSSIQRRDMPVISGLTFIGAVFYILGNLATDLLYATVDPRVKLQ